MTVGLLGSTNSGHGNLFRLHFGIQCTISTSATEGIEYTYKNAIR